MLHALGISKDTLLSKQRHHFNLLKNARSDFRDAFRFLSYVNCHNLAERVLLDGLESVKSQINGKVNEELKKMLNKQGGQKCRIMVPKSRLLFGVCDAWDVLKEWECAVKVTLEENGLPHALKNTEIIVIRNPCLHPGDWQKFKVVERPELSHLVDCVVFSTRGRRPAADLMSGGDLDGDTCQYAQGSEVYVLISYSLCFLGPRPDPLNSRSSSAISRRPRADPIPPHHRR